MLEKTKQSFWGADTQTVDKFLCEMELVKTKKNEKKLEEPTLEELEFIFKTGESPDVTAYRLPFGERGKVHLIR